MKILTIFLLTMLFSRICFSQAADTVRVYDYLKPGDGWKLEIRHDKMFTLYTKQFSSEHELIITGTCEVGDTTIRFICDTSKLTNRYLAREPLKQFSNIPFILCGQPFPKENDFFIPRNIHYTSRDSTATPTGMFAKYYRSDGFNCNNIELQQDGSYVFYHDDCMAHFKEEGSWTLDGNMLTLSPKQNKWSMLEWVTMDRTFFLTENHLVGKKVEKTVTQAKKTVVTETFIFLSK